MRRIVIWLATTVTVVVLLFGYYTSTNSPAPASVAGNVPATSPSAEPATTPSPSSSATGSAAPSPTSSAPPPPDPSATPSSKTYTGSTAQTRWGPVQVKITVVTGTITHVDVLQQPDGNPRDQEINDYALPILVQDTITAQSAHIDMISGATVTSSGYVQSLQAALDAAGL